MVLKEASHKIADNMKIGKCNKCGTVLYKGMDRCRKCERWITRD